ncbi:hypothetical protein [Mesobacillus zeae]|uniref:hypothetical protein n=1 Tax=Mesobacillus zeae TaxID=1917180 RepID=UPI0015E76649|nr:hypothetical protein [Mesobacillus zeae]
MSQNYSTYDTNSHYNNSDAYTGSSMRSSNLTGNSKLLRGVVIGGVIGGVVAMLDSKTRNKIKDTAVNVKDSSMNMISEVKSNPGDVKNQMVSSFKEALKVLQEAVSDAQNLYERLNNDMFGKMGEVKELTSHAMDTAMEAKDGLKDIGSKVKEAGSTMMENPFAEAAGTKSSASSNGSGSTYATGSTSSNGSGSTYATGSASSNGSGSTYATGSTTTQSGSMGVTSNGFGSAASGNSGFGMTNGQGTDRIPEAGSYSMDLGNSVSDMSTSTSTGNTKFVSPKKQKNNNNR